MGSETPDKSKPWNPLFQPAGSRKWWCKVPRRNGGRYHRKPTGQYDRKLALVVWRQLCLKELTGEDNAPKDYPSFVDAFDRRVEERRQAGRAQGTLDMYEVKGGHLKRVIGEDTPLDQVDAAAIDDYIAQRTREGAKPSTVHKELSVLRGTLRLARRRKEYPHALDEVMPLDFSPKYKPRTRALSMGEVSALLLALSPKRAAIAAFICATGATYPSEVAPWQDGDKRGHLVHLRGTKRETRDRWVPVPVWARRWLKAALRHAPFPRWSNVRRDLHAACDAAGIAHCSPNDLRRTFGHQLRARGVAPHLIAAMMGHVDSRMAERVYAKLQPDELAHLLGAKPVQSRKAKTGKLSKKTA